MVVLVWVLDLELLIRPDKKDRIRIFILSDLSYVSYPIYVIRSVLSDLSLCLAPSAGARSFPFSGRTTGFVV